MNARVSTCFGLSVLLHALVLLAISSYQGLGIHRNGNWNPSASRKLDVYLQATAGNPVLQAAPPKPRIEKIAPARIPKQEKAAATDAIQNNADKNSPSPPFGFGLPPSPRVQAQYQTQMNARQMFAIQEQQRAIVQSQLMISRLQGDIEQELNRNGTPVAGDCSWQENPQSDPDRPVCDPTKLDSLIQPQAQQLNALRKAMGSLGNILDGFKVTTNGGAATITYRTRAAPPKR